MPQIFCNIRIIKRLISSEQIASIDLVLNVPEDFCVKAVGNDDVALTLELCEVINNLTVEEFAAVLKSRLIDDDRDAFCLDAFHNALDCGGAEIIGVTLHRQAVYAYRFRILRKDLIGNKVFANGV